LPFDKPSVFQFVNTPFLYISYCTSDVTTCLYNVNMHVLYTCALHVSKL
jgi:hypothetical protein